MSEECGADKYIKCSKCKCKYHNTDDSIKQYFGYNRLDERFKVCMKCRQYRMEHQDNTNERASKLVACDKCGEYVRYNYLAKHKTTNKCINFSRNNYKTDYVYCGLCGSIVTDNCMVKHQASDKCKKRTELKKQCC